MRSARVADIAIDSRSAGQDAMYTYRLDGPGEVGDAFFVPLGPRSALGFATAVYTASEEDLGFPFSALKSVHSRVEGLGLPRSVIDLASFVASEYLAPLPVALTAAIPPGVRDRLLTTWSVVEPTPPDPTLTTLQEEVLRSLRDQGGVLVESKSKKQPANIVRALKLLKAKGLVEQSLTVTSPGERRKADRLLRLCPDSARIDAFLANEGRRKPAQALTLMRLQAAEHSALSASEIKAMSGVTDTTVRTLLEAGLLEPIEPEAMFLATPPKPNPAQQLAIDAVVESIHEGEFRSFMLYGVTGSGKTEVYLRSASEALRRGRQVLYLVPEIALAAQAIGQLRERFGRRVTIVHSELPQGERLQNFLRIRAGEAPVVLGARSAVFAPLSDIGLIVMDEEHEASYKQESSPRYHAKQLALYLGKRHRCPVILGSATPSLESFYEAEQERLSLLSLPERAASAVLPDVHVQDLTEGYRAGRPSILTNELHERMGETLARGEQVILFLNRRAYAPFVICRDCGEQMVCPNCAVSLSYHRRDTRLKCHHCGYSTRPPDICPICQGTRLNAFGVGTEKVEESIRELFPDHRIARLDRDIARRKGALEETLASFRSGDIHVLVGTQMVAKGLDFPNVTLVGVIAADVSLNIPDFRSSERTFQLLSQVAGRAGRGKAKGHVVIQTFNPLHPAVKSAQLHDFLSFYEALKSERDQAGYPPFRRLVNVILSGPSKTEVIHASEEVAALLIAANLDAAILGPVDCALERLQDRWRRHLLIKLPPNASAAPVGEALTPFASKGVQLTVDVDPYSLM